LSLVPEWIVPHWPAPPGVRALITPRAGGVSQGSYGAGGRGGLNLGFGCGDAAEAVAANRTILRRALPAEPAWLRQVHGATVVDAAVSGGEPPAADASFTDRRGVVAAVLMADCLPVLLADTAGRGVAVAHAGWRGLAAGAVQATVQALRRCLGSPAATLCAYLGPAIGPDHFEVGVDVRSAMCATLPGAEADFVAHAPGKYLADLYALARRALADAGVSEVYGGGLCTFCDVARFYSYRRDRVCGRHAALIWIDP
jgi:YfiH family protein